jgi:WD40 repeat protein
LPRSIEFSPLSGSACIPGSLAAAHAMANDPPEGGAAAAAAAGAPPDGGAVPGPLSLQLTLSGHARAVSSVKLSPLDDGLLASASADQTVRLWRLAPLAGGEPATAAGDGGDGGDDGGPAASSPHEASPPGGMQHGSGVNDVAWGPLGDVLASAADDGVVRLWDAATGSLLRELPGHTNYAYACQFDPAGRMLVRAGPGGLVLVVAAERAAGAGWGARRGGGGGGRGRRPGRRVAVGAAARCVLGGDSPRCDGRASPLPDAKGPFGRSPQQRSGRPRLPLSA